MTNPLDVTTVSLGIAWYHLVSLGKQFDRKLDMSDTEITETFHLDPPGSFEDQQRRLQVAQHHLAGSQRGGRNDVVFLSSQGFTKKRCLVRCTYVQGVPGILKLRQVSPT